MQIFWKDYQRIILIFETRGSLLYWFHNIIVYWNHLTHRSNETFLFIKRIGTSIPSLYFPGSLHFSCTFQISWSRIIQMFSSSSYLYWKVCVPFLIVNTRHICRWSFESKQIALTETQTKEQKRNREKKKKDFPSLFDFVVDRVYTNTKTKPSHWNTLVTYILIYKSIDTEFCNPRFLFFVFLFFGGCFRFLFIFWLSLFSTHTLKHTSSISSCQQQQL